MPEEREAERVHAELVFNTNASMKRALSDRQQWAQQVHMSRAQQSLMAQQTNMHDGLGAFFSGVLGGSGALGVAGVRMFGMLP